MAASLQFPFLHIGSQLDSTSLQHPQSPHLVTFARPLWRLWELFDGITDIKTYSTQSHPEYFGTDSGNTGASSMTAGNGDTLLIMANYLGEARTCRLNISGELSANKKLKAFKLNVGHDNCSVEEIKSGNEFSFGIDAYGLLGILFVSDDASWKAKLNKFIRPYPSCPAEENEYKSMLENLKKLRFNPCEAKDVYMKVEIPNYPNNYEDSLMFDFYDNVIELRELFDDGRHERLGYITPSGLSAQMPSKNERLYPWSDTPWISLHNIIRHKGTAKLAFVTKRGEYEFYSYVRAKISDKPEITDKTYEITYNNDIDMDWSVLNFNINLL